MGCSWPTSARWAGLDKRPELDLRPGPVCCGGCAGGPAELPVKDGVGPGDAGAGPGVGLPQGRVGCRRRRLRDVADLPGGTGGPYVLDGTTVWPLDPLDQSGTGFGRPRKPKLRPGQRRTMEQRGDELPDEAWREITVEVPSSEELWAVWRPGRQRAATTCPTLPVTPAWVGPGGALKRMMGLDECWAGWHHHMPRIPAEPAFQDWGEKDALGPTGWWLAPGAVRARSIAVVASYATWPASLGRQLQAADCLRRLRS